MNKNKNKKNIKIEIKPHNTGKEKLVDNPVDTWMIAHSGPTGRKLAGEYKRRFEILDTTNVKNGDFSIKFTSTKTTSKYAYGFNSGQYIDSWILNEEFSLHLWIKAVANEEPENWELALYDTTGNRLVTIISGMKADNQWREFIFSLKKFVINSEFDFTSICSVQIETDLPRGANLWLDDVYFSKDEKVLGISDKTITQYMAESDLTRSKRVREVFASTKGMAQFISLLWNGKELKKTNQEIIEWTNTIQDGPNGTWHLGINNIVHWLYYGFSSKGCLKPGRLTSECEKILLDFYWEHTKYKNDIASASRDSWIVAGSENHDINLKMSNLISSQIFMNEPEYAERIYPDLGRMIGYMYGQGFISRMYNEDEKYKKRLKLGSGDYKDDNEYTAKDHYQAWVKFWKEFIAERARHGFFIEHNATGYMYHTNRFLHEIYAWCEDEELCCQTRKFIDLVWAQWAQDQLLTIQGGATTRKRSGMARMGKMAEFLLGGPAKDFGYFYVFSDYQWPRAIWELMLDHSGKDEYAFVSRKPNEEQDIWPRPTGTEYSMIIRPDSRLVRYSWVTPDYVMGLRMDHPAAMYCHLSVSAQGIIFPTTPEAVIQISASYYRAVQDRNVALLQPKKNFLIRHPNWFPGIATKLNPVSVVFGKDIDCFKEKDGWVFVKEGNAYVAFKIVSPSEKLIGENGFYRPVDYDDDGFGLLEPEKDAYTWSENKQGGSVVEGRSIVAKDLHAALIIEASRREHHSSFEEFQQDMLNNTLKLKQVIGNGFIVTYKGCRKDARELYLNCANSEIPKIDDDYLSYDCPTFESPYLKGEFGSGVITITGSVSGEKLVLDFNKFN